MAFSGWSAEAVEFYQELQADNTKAWLDVQVGPSMAAPRAER